MKKLLLVAAAFLAVSSYATNTTRSIVADKIYPSASITNGDLTLNSNGTGKVKSANNFAVGSDKFTVTSAAGNTVVSGTLSALGSVGIGDSTHRGVLTITGTASGHPVCSLDDQAATSGRLWNLYSGFTAAGSFDVINSTDSVTGLSITNTGDVSVTNVAAGTWNGTAIAANKGGTGQTSYTLGDTLYASGSSAVSKLAGNTTASMMVLTQTGTGSASAAPAWTLTTGTGNIVRSTNPQFSGFLNLGGNSASQALFTDGSKNVVSNTITGSGSVVMSTGATIGTATLTGATITSPAISGATMSGTTTFPGSTSVDGSGNALFTSLGLGTGGIIPGTGIILGVNGAPAVNGAANVLVDISGGGAQSGTTSFASIKSHPQVSNGATISSLRHYEAASFSSGTSTVTSQYGYYAGTLSGATNNYAFFANGNDSIFNGKLRLGSSTAPSSTLDVTGTAAISSTLTVPTIDAGSATSLVLKSNGTTGITLDTSQNVAVAGTGTSTFGGAVQSGNGLSTGVNAFRGKTTNRTATATNSATPTAVTATISTAGYPGMAIIYGTNSGNSAQVMYGASSTVVITNIVGTEFTAGSGPAASKTGLTYDNSTGILSIYNRSGADQTYGLAVFGF